MRLKRAIEAADRELRTWCIHDDVKHPVYAQLAHEAGVDMAIQPSAVGSHVLLDACVDAPLKASIPNTWFTVATQRVIPIGRHHFEMRVAKMPAADVITPSAVTSAVTSSPATVTSTSTSTSPSSDASVSRPSLVFGILLSDPPLQSASCDTVWTDEVTYVMRGAADRTVVCVCRCGCGCPC